MTIRENNQDSGEYWQCDYCDRGDHGLCPWEADPEYWKCQCEVGKCEGPFVALAGSSEEDARDTAPESEQVRSYERNGVGDRVGHDSSGDVLNRWQRAFLFIIGVVAVVFALADGSPFWDLPRWVQGAAAVGGLFGFYRALAWVFYGGVGQ